MNLSGRRESSNVDDRRGRRGGKIAGVGIGGAIIIGIICLILGKNPADVINNSQLTGGTETETAYQPTAEEEELAKFARQILAGTEDVWTAEFKKMGKTYVPPKLVLFTESVQSGCGGATSSTGPFYCSADQSVYIDLSFFSSMKQQLGADGDFAYAYVIAHEVGHHVQYLLGTLQDAHNKMSRLSEKEANKISVRLELQADFYAGVWAYHDNEMFGSLEDGDIEERSLQNRRRLPAKEGTRLHRPRELQPRHLRPTHQMAQERTAHRQCQRRRHLHTPILPIVMRMGHPERR